MTTFSKEALKSALIELAQSDRAFFASLITDLMSGAGPGASPEPGTQNATTPLVDTSQPAKITPAYRKNGKVLREKYAMDKAVLLKLQDLFADGPTAEEFLQASKG